MPELPLSRQPACPVCRPHEWHLLACDSCPCEHPPIPGIHLDTRPRR